jgi:hypothetical protein
MVLYESDIDYVSIIKKFFKKSGWKVMFLKEAEIGTRQGFEP